MRNYDLEFLKKFSLVIGMLVLVAFALLLGALYLNGTLQRDQILNRQRDVVSAVTRFLKRAYPARITAQNQTALTMMLFGMINWTFTWLRPGGALSYRGFADEVIAVLERGLAS